MNSVSQTEKTFLQKHEWLIPLGLFLFFLVLTLPGISWGAPSIWHPDEIVVRSINAVHGELQFSETNFDYPDLPQYAMFFLGKLILALGYTDGEILIASRILSAVLAGLTVILTYIITRRIGCNIYVAGLSGLLLISVSEMSHNGRFAHNDTYLIFFTTLAILLLLEYTLRHNKLWLYASFFTVGLAASSKFTGGSLILAPLTVYLIEQKDNIKKKWLSILISLFIGGLLAFWGFGLGTPKVLVAPFFYLKHLLPTLQWQTTYGYQPDSIRGILGQYGVMANGLGLALVLLFGTALVWAIWKVVRAYRERTASEQPQVKSFAVILLVIFVLDLPMMISYNYQLRYFLTLMPFLAILAAFFIEEMVQRKPAYPIVVGLIVSAVILYSVVRIISLMLLVRNDARIPASAFMDTLRTGTSLEHTFYPPSLPAPGYFEREHNYPIYFTRDPDEPLPESKKFKYNAGEAGLVDRKTDYLVIDSFTANKFKNQYFCEAMPVECAFFKQLETGRSEHYKLLAEFEYSLPPYLPQLKFEFINPAIYVYERIP